MPKSAQCRTRWHHKCQHQIECDDGSAFICECDCHQVQSVGVVAQSIADVAAPVLFPQQEGAPPSYPASIDHGRRRIAEEPSGTDPNLPWQSTRCVECREQVWAKNQRTVEREEAVCETCYYMTVSEHYDEMAKKQRRIGLRFHNPFEL